MQVHTLVLGDLETNCYVLHDGNGKALLIDPAEKAEKITDFLKQEQLTLGAVVLTHAHFDHMLAAQAVCAATGAPLYVGEGDGAAMTDPIRNLSGWFSQGAPVCISTYETLKDGEIVEVGGTCFTVLNTPGHTPGCICLYTEGHLFAGDTLFMDSIGRLDFPGGDERAMAQSLNRLMRLPEDTKVYPGHGPATTIGREARHNPYLR